VSSYNAAKAEQLRQMYAPVKDMVRRDYFAAHAPFDMASAWRELSHRHQSDGYQPTTADAIALLAKMRVDYAEAMCRELAR
jgi:hypothetical protein